MGNNSIKGSGLNNIGWRVRQPDLNILYRYWMNKEKANEINKDKTKRCGYCSHVNKINETHCQKCREKFNYVSI